MANTIPEIVKKYRETQRKTLREFAEAITECCGEGVTYQSVHNWENGVTNPNKWLLCRMILKCSGDWRYEFASDCLSVLDPKVFAELSEVTSVE